MESNHYLIDFYKAYDEDGRLQSKHELKERHH